MTHPDTNKGDEPATETTRQKIVRAAGKLFEKKGLENTSVGEIAELAGVSVPEAYRYVRRKSEIMLLIMEDFTDQVLNHIRKNIEGLDDPREQLVRAMTFFYSSVARNAPQAFLLYRESKTLDEPGRAKIMAAELAIVDIFKTILQKGMDQGVFAPHDSDLVAYDIIILGHAWVLKRWHFQKRFELQAYIDSQAALILKSITA